MRVDNFTLDDGRALRLHDYDHFHSVHVQPHEQKVTLVILDDVDTHGRGVYLSAGTAFSIGLRLIGGAIKAFFRLTND
jgi:hypothetical protein